MLSWAITFLVIALIAGILGMTGVMSTAMNIAWILAIIGLILFVISMFTGRRGGPPAV